MATSCDLYELIGSLTKTEKRYCRMMLESGTGRKANSCLRLFEILSSLRDLEESAVRAAVAGEPFARHLAVTKNHLYDHLVRSLCTFAAVRGMRSRINGLIEATEVLLGKGLLRQAREQLREARELAERYNFMTGQVVIAQMSWRLDSYDGYEGVTVEDLRERRDRVHGVLDDMRNYWDHLHAYAVMSRELIHRGPSGSSANAESSDESIHELFHALPPPASPNARRMHLDAQRTYHMLTARYDDAYEHAVESLRYVESFPMKDRLRRLNYISILVDYVIMSTRTGRMTEARRALATLEGLEPEDRVLRNHQERATFYCRLTLAMVDLDHEAVAAMRGEMEEICSRDKDEFARQFPIGYALDLAYAQFANGLLREAVETLHPVINDYRPGFRDDMLCIARHFQLMLHFDLGDIELLPYLVRSAYRFISRCRGISEVDRVVLRFMRRLPGIATREKLLAEFARVREELLAVSHDPAEREASAVMAIIPWLDSKITGRPFGELAREMERVGERACGQACE